MGLPTSVDITANGDIFHISTFNAQHSQESLHQQPVNIFASGPSIADLKFTDDRLQQPGLFVNGSISLTTEHQFSNIAGYVISDARFINHHPEILTTHYSGQPLYATLAVFEAIAICLPELVMAHHPAFRVIFPVDRPWGVQTNRPWHRPWLNRFAFIDKLFNKKTPLSHFSEHPSFVIDSQHQPSPIGVSLDMSHGFVEAGTVAYVAAQLAFSRQASAIHLFGIDLLNSNQPRFYENKDNSAPCKLDKAIADRIVPSFDLLGRVYDEHGIKVINHSPISKDLFNSLKVEIDS